MIKSKCPECDGSKVLEAEGSTYTEKCIECGGKGFVYKSLTEKFRELLA